MGQDKKIKYLIKIKSGFLTKNFPKLVKIQKIYVFIIKITKLLKQSYMIINNSDNYIRKNSIKNLLKKFYSKTNFLSQNSFILNTQLNVIKLKIYLKVMKFFIFRK